jgi:hypothetical protein
MRSGCAAGCAYISTCLLLKFRCLPLPLLPHLPTPRPHSPTPAFPLPLPRIHALPALACPALPAVVVDPIQSVKGKVVIDAFRCIRWVGWVGGCCWWVGGWRRAHNDMQGQGLLRWGRAQAVSVVGGPKCAVDCWVWPPLSSSLPVCSPQTMMLGQEPRQTTSNVGHLNKPSIQVGGSARVAGGWPVGRVVGDFHVQGMGLLPVPAVAYQLLHDVGDRPPTPLRMVDPPCLTCAQSPALPGCTRH